MIYFIKERVMDQRTSAEAKIICKVEHGYLDIRLRIPGKWFLAGLVAVLVYYLPDLARVVQAVLPFVKP
jgi:hypothetical protein